MQPSENQLDAVLDYHSRTKHHLHRFAASLGYLDWSTQPEPFRTFAGAPVVDLPLSADHVVSTRYDGLYSMRSVPAAPVNRDTVAALLELALGLSAWKQYQNARWALRCNPSSGNLHPTEGYVVVPARPGLDAGVYHYLSAIIGWKGAARQVLKAAERLERTLQGSLLIGLSSIHWREAWKYGERAFRYCQHDIGHAIATVRFAAAALGWQAKLLEVSDRSIAVILGLAREEDSSGIDEADREHPDALLAVGPAGAAEIDIAGVQDIVNSGAWSGRPNVLSPEHIRWPIIEAAAQATWRSESAVPPTVRVGESAAVVSDWIEPGAGSILATTIIRQRRSAVSLDDFTSIPAATFYRMLDRLLPRAGAAPWDILPWRPHLHCGIFVHRVDGLAPGLYLFLRNPDSLESVKSALNPTFVFEHPDDCPEYLPLFKLVGGDFRQQAQVVSCQQKIAGAGAFSLGMIAEFNDSLRSIGAWWYRRLFWEAGVLGQTLYLEAEAAGVRGTGIGCYFDDAFHSILGLRDNQLQSLYHFTVGGPIEDTRLQTIPAYAHLNSGNR